MKKASFQTKKKNNQYALDIGKDIDEYTLKKTYIEPPLLLMSVKMKVKTNLI